MLEFTYEAQPARVVFGRGSLAHPHGSAQYAPNTSKGMPARKPRIPLSPRSSAYVCVRW